MSVVVRIKNYYSDEHESTSEVELPVPAEGMLDEWWQEIVYPHTGDGHGADSDLGSCYNAVIVAGPPALLGESYEWID